MRFCNELRRVVVGGGLEVQFDSQKYSSRSGVQISTD